MNKDRGSSAVGAPPGQRGGVPVDRSAHGAELPIQAAYRSKAQDRRERRTVGTIVL